MGSRSASGEDEPLSSPLWQRAKVFYPHLFCYPVSITNTQIKWLWKLTKQWKYIKPKKPAPYREVLNRTFCHGKTKLCFIPVNTTSRRIWTAMSSSDISPETSGCRTSALWYFPLGSKLLSEVFHLFIIFFVDWEKRDGIHIFVHGSTGELCCTGGYRMKPRVIYPAGTSHCFTHISTRSHLGRRVHSPAQPDQALGSPKSAHPGLTPSVKSFTNTTLMQSTHVCRHERADVSMWPTLTQHICVIFQIALKKTRINFKQCHGGIWMSEVTEVFFSFLDSQGFKKPFHSRLGKGEIGHLPRAKFSSAFPNTNATTEWNASKVAQNQAMLLDTHKYLLYTSIYKALHMWWIC